MPSLRGRAIAVDDRTRGIPKLWLRRGVISFRLMTLGLSTYRGQESIDGFENGLEIFSPQFNIYIRIERK